MRRSDQSVSIMKPSFSQSSRFDFEVMLGTKRADFLRTACLPHFGSNDFLISRLYCSGRGEIAIFQLVEGKSELLRLLRMLWTSLSHKVAPGLGHYCDLAIHQRGICHCSIRFQLRQSTFNVTLSIIKESKPMYAVEALRLSSMRSCWRTMIYSTLCWISGSSNCDQITVSTAQHSRNRRALHVVFVTGTSRWESSVGLALFNDHCLSDASLL